ncbi:MAG: helix-turn-helix transcriptional regulator [Ilumatobacter sp.]|nr:helix-turn-helix transcriptional regulator [Ilumatobacter sp.]
MRTLVRPDAAVQRVAECCAAATTGHDLFERLSQEMHDLITHDGAVWFGADPATLLVTSPVRVEALEDSCCDVYWHNEFHVQDAARYVDLARSPVPAASLQLATDGRPGRSARYRELLEPQGYVDELRGVLRLGDNTWGMLGLFRERGRAAFSEADVALLGRCSSVIGRALRDHVRAQSPWLGTACAPGLVVFDERSRVTSANPEALTWLRALLPDGAREAANDVPVVSAVEELLAADARHRHASPVWALLNRARASDGGFDGHAARLRMRDMRGRWLVLHGSRLRARNDDTGGSVAVVIEPAKSAEIAPIIVEAYALTARERDVVGALARGESTSEIAAHLFLSQHTVRDHIKTVFEKLEVSSRTELVAKLFTEHYTAPAHADMVHPR